jgi:hypothetical protein
MKFKAKYRAPRLDLARFKKALDREMTDLLTKAAAEWLHNTADTIPVWTGASRATFSVLASAAGYQLDPGFAVAPDSRVASADFGAGTGTFLADTKDGRYTFSYHSTLPHLYINENYDARPWGFRLTTPGPYHFEEKGAEAFKAYVAGIGMTGITAFVTSSRVK